MPPPGAGLAQQPGDVPVPPPRLPKDSGATAAHGAHPLAFSRLYLSAPKPSPRASAARGECQTHRPGTAELSRGCLSAPSQRERNARLAPARESGSALSPPHRSHRPDPSPSHPAAAARSKEGPHKYHRQRGARAQRRSVLREPWGALSPRGHTSTRARGVSSWDDRCPGDSPNSPPPRAALPRLPAVPPGASEPGTAPGARPARAASCGWHGWGTGVGWEPEGMWELKGRVPRATLGI